MSPGLFDKRYLAELEQLLEAEAHLRRQGTELLDDPEYRALRDRFIEGDLTLAQLSERVDTLAATRGEEDVPLPRPGDGTSPAGRPVAGAGIDEADDGADGAAGGGSAGDGAGDGD